MNRRVMDVESKEVERQKEGDWKRRARGRQKVERERQEIGEERQRED